MTPEIESPTRFAPKHRSGIDVIDETWGGLYRGGSYLVYGQAMSGRGLLALMIAQTGAMEKENTLFISSERRKDIFIQAASIGFDLRSAHKSGSIRLIRVPTLAQVRNETDEQMAQSLSELIDVITRQNPSRVIVMDFTPFVAFRSQERFQHEFIRFLDDLDTIDATVVLVMPEPANAHSRNVIEFMGRQMTGSIHIELVEGEQKSTRRCISLLPHIGHIRHRVVDYWDLEDVIADRGLSKTPAQVPEWDAATGDIAASEFPASTAPKATSIEGAAPEATASEGSRREAPASVGGASPGYQVKDYTSRLGKKEPAKPAPVEQEPAFEQDPAFEPESVRPTDPVVPEQTSGFESIETDYSDRERFTARIETLFDRRDTTHEPFLLLALRMDRTGEKAVRPFDFDFLMDLVLDSLKPADDCYIDSDNERLVVCLSNSLPTDAKDFFAGLKKMLRHETPVQADHLLHNVLAIVVPNGRPFTSADEFMTYALDNG